MRLHVKDGVIPVLRRAFLGAVLSGSNPDVACAAEEPPLKLVGTIASNTIRIAFLEVAEQPLERVVGDCVGSARIIEIDPVVVRLRMDDGPSDDLRISRGSYIIPTPPPSPIDPSTRAFHLEQ